MSEEQKNFIDDIIPFNIEGRYPEYKQKLYDTVEESEYKILIKETERFVLWIKNRLEN